ATNAKDNVVATVGKVTVHPNATNVIPGEVEVKVEIRGEYWDAVQNVETAISEWCKDNIDATILKSYGQKPTLLSEKVQHHIVDACENQQVSYQHIFSGAG